MSIVAHFLDGPLAREVREIPDLPRVEIPVMKEHAQLRWSEPMAAFAIRPFDIWVYRPSPCRHLERGTWSDPRHYQVDGGPY